MLVLFISFLLLELAMGADTLSNLWITLGWNIAGDIWDHVSTQPNKMYNKGKCWHFHAESRFLRLLLFSFLQWEIWRLQAYPTLPRPFK